jgi:glucan biosynthesis protein C
VIRNSAVAPDRLHYVDNLRAFVMSIGVIVHAGVIHHSTSVWLIHIASGVFRMKLFILIAGFFAALLVERRGLSNVIRERIVRFGFPAVTAVILLNPVANYFYYLSHVRSTSLAEFLSQGLSYNRAGFAWGSEAPIYMSWHLHIWFIIAALVLCLAMPIAFMVEQSRPFQVWRDGLLSLEKRRRLGAFGLALSLACIAVLMRTAHFATTQQMLSGGPLNFVAQTCWLYAPYFLLGIAAYRSQPLFSMLRKVRWIETGGAIALLIVAVPLQRLIVARFGFVAGEIVEYFVQGIAGTYVIILLFAAFERFAHRSNRAARFLADASYTIYIGQMLVLAILQYLLMQEGFSTLSNYFISVVVSYAILLLLHRYVVDTNPVLRLLINGKPWWRAGVAQPAHTSATS